MATATIEKITVARVDEMMRAVFQEIKNEGGKARPKDIFAAITPKLNLTPYELALTRSQTIRWHTVIRFYTIDCVKAAFLQKSNGHWILTEEGEKALKLPEGELIRLASAKYQQWRSEQENNDDPVDEAPEAGTQTIYEQAVESAQEEIERRLNELDPYEFQNLVAELLRAMGYHVPYIAPPGPDGGIDLTAYRDPLGTVTPRIKVQVKHRVSKVGAKDVREMEGLLRKDGDIGLIVSSGGFSSEAERELRSSNRHIETMDQDRMIELWKMHYEKLSERGKAYLPLVKVYFLAPAEE